MKHIDHVGIFVRDLNRLVEFYTTVVGLELKDRTKLPNGTELAFLKIGAEGMIELIQRASPPGDRPAGPVYGPHHVAFHVDSVADWVQRLQQHGVRMTSGPSEFLAPSGRCRIAFFADPEGNVLELFERENDL